MHHQPQSVIANAPDRCADWPRAEIPHAQLCSNGCAMAERSSVKELWASSRAIAFCRGYLGANESHGAVDETELLIIDDGDSGFDNFDNARFPGTRTRHWKSFDATRCCPEVTRIECRERQAIVSVIPSDIDGLRCRTASPARRLTAMAKNVAAVSAAGSRLLALLGGVGK